MATKKVNIDIIAKDKSKQALNKIRGNLDGLKKSVFNLRNAFIGLGAGLVIRSIVNTGKEIENLQVRLKFLFGTAEEGAKAFDEMAKFASKVPFSLQEIQAGSGVLAVVSKDAEELAKNMELTGNVAAVTGLDFKTTAEQIQRSLSAGISAADLFRDRGVKSMLGFKAGATVSVEETVEAFDRVFGAGGKFAGATDELAKTFEGTLSMIGDKMFNFKRTILESGFFPELKQQFGDLNKFLEENQKGLDTFAEKIGRGLAVAVRKLGDGLIFVKDNLGTIETIFKSIIALKVGALFWKMARGIQAMVVGTTALVALSGPAGWALITGAVIAAGTAYAGLGKLIDNIAEGVGEANDAFRNGTATADMYHETIRTLNAEIKKMEESDRIIDENGNSIDDLRIAVELFKEELLGLKDAGKEGEFGFSSLGASIQNTIDIQKGLNEKTKDLSDTFQDLTHKHTMSKPYQDLTIAIKEAIDATEHMRVAQKLTAEQAGLVSRKETQAEKDLLEQKKASSKGAIAIFQTEQEMRLALSEHMKTESISTMQILSGMNKKAFEAYKAMQISQAIINTYSAALAAYARFGGGWSGAFAAAASVAHGMAMVAQIKSQSYSGKQQGGPVQKDKPYIVGEAGREMFVPNQSGNIVPNHELGQPVNVNFNINTVDARGFNELLTNSRATIVGMINSAVNETGRQAII